MPLGAVGATRFVLLYVGLIGCLPVIVGEYTVNWC